MPFLNGVMLGNALILRLAFLKVVSATFLPVWFVFLKESTLETRKNAFYFT